MYINTVKYLDIYFQVIMQKLALNLVHYND